MSYGNKGAGAPAVGNVTNTGQQPTITWHLTIYPAVGNVTNYGQIPTVTSGVQPVFNASPQTGLIFYIGNVPQVSRGTWTAVQARTGFWTPVPAQSTIWN